MKKFIMADLRSEDKREMKIAAIKNNVPDFKEDGKSDAYVDGYYSAITATKSSKEAKKERETENLKRSNMKEQTKQDKKEGSAVTNDHAEIAEMKNKRLNMRK